MKYPSIQQYRHIIKFMEERNIRNQRFRGTVKVHGTNARVIVPESGPVRYGSKNQEINDGHYGFVAWAKERSITASVPAPYTIYGEWAGKGIQSGVPYPKCLIVFAVHSEHDDKWYTDSVVDDSADGTYNVGGFGTSYLDLRLDDLAAAEEAIRKRVEEIDKQCPVAKFLGYEEVHGEGVVYVPTDSNDPSLGFKAKGESHKTTRVPRTKKPEIAGLKEFLDATVTEPRLQQGLEHFSTERKNTASFIKWVIGDIEKEDADLIPDDADKRKFLGAVGPVAAKWFIGKCNTQ